MAIRDVIRMGNPILRVTAAKVPIDEIGSDKMRDLLKDLYDTMLETEGIGIAAPQIGISSQVAIVKIPSDSNRYDDVKESVLYTIINPTIEVIGHEKQGFWEGCLSVPGLRGHVERPKDIRVSFFDENAEEKTLELSGLLATVFQHEIDHLFGKVFIDRMSDLSKLSFEEEYSEFWITE